MRKILLLILFLVAVVAGYFFFLKDNSADSQRQSQQQGQQQAMPVPTITTEKTAIQISKEFSGRLVAVNYAEIRPQVSGTITKLRFEDGQRVRKGQILLTIDTRPYKAAVARDEALLATAKNEVILARKDLNRAKGLIKTDSISQRLFDERQTAIDTANAAIRGARAQLEQSRINLGFAYVKAPITGRVSRAELTVGNLVQAGPNAPILTTIVSDDGIFADFEIDEQTYLNYIRANTSNLDDEQKVPVSIIIGDQEYNAVIESFDNRIDPTSGTIRARALLKNKDLLPGMYATARITSPKEQQAILIPERAIGTNQDRKFVYLIQDGVAVMQPVKLGGSIKSKRIVTEGLTEGQTIISDGIIRVRPGAPVVSKEG